MIGNAYCVVSGDASLNGGRRSACHADGPLRLSLVRNAGRSTRAVGNAPGLLETISRVMRTFCSGAGVEHSMAACVMGKARTRETSPEARGDPASHSEPGAWM